MPPLTLAVFVIGLCEYHYIETMGRFVAGFLLLLGCSSCTLPDEMPEPKLPVQVSASVDGARACDDRTCTACGWCSKTRTGMTGSTAAFVAGDKIGVSEALTGRQNVLYTFSGTSWSAAATMYWRNATSAHTFYAYYPYQANSSGTSAVLPLLSDQTVSASTPVPDATCDMLVAGPKTQSRAAGGSVALTFTHAFSLLQFNIRLGSLLNLYVLNNITVQGGNLTDATNRYGLVNLTSDPALINYDLTTGTIRDYGNRSTVYATSLSRDFASFSLLTSTTPFYFLVLPGTYKNPKASVRITVALAGIISTGSSVELPQNTFAPNTKYTYDIRIGGILLAADDVQVELVSQETFCIETPGKVSR